MADGIQTKETFGGCDADHFVPAASEAWPKAINVFVSFKEALKLHLAVGQTLARLNSYKWSRTAGRRSAVNLCIYTRTRRITMNEWRINE